MGENSPRVKEVKPKGRWQFVDLREIVAYRDLFYFLVERDVKVIYKQTVLGFAWAIIRPVLTMFVFTVVFGRLAKIPSDGIPYPIFFFSALVPWLFFQTALTKSTTSLAASGQILSKVYFPRLLIPLSPIVAGLVDFAVSIVLLCIMLLFYGMTPSWALLHLPLLVCIMVLTTSGLGILLSALAVHYRDVRFAVQFFAQLLMYAAPVVWPASLVPEKWRVVYGAYPMAGVIEGFRSVFVGTNPMPWDLLWPGLVSSLLLLIVALFVFGRTESVFADVA